MYGPFPEHRCSVVSCCPNDFNVAPIQQELLPDVPFGSYVRSTLFGLHGYKQVCVELANMFVYGRKEEKRPLCHIMGSNILLIPIYQSDKS